MCRDEAELIIRQPAYCTYYMLTDNLSEVGVACTTIGTNTAAEDHICVRKLVNAVAADR